MGWIASNAKHTFVNLVSLLNFSVSNVSIYSQKGLLHNILIFIGTSTCVSNEVTSTEDDTSSPAITSSTTKMPNRIPSFYENLNRVKTYRSDLSNNVKPIESYPSSRVKEIRKIDQTEQAINDLSVKVSDLILLRLQNKLNNTFNTIFDKRNRFKLKEVKNSNNFFNYM